MPQGEPSDESNRKPMLTLPDGTQVFSSGRSVVPKSPKEYAQEVESGTKAKATLARMHRKLHDLPESPQALNAINAVLVYTQVGLDDADIAVALQTTVENIGRLRGLEAYQQMQDMFDKTVFEDARRQAKHIISGAADKAATAMVNAVDSEDENIRVVASRDVLKLAGITTEEERNKTLSGLRIEIIKRENGKEDTINVTLGDKSG